MELLYFCNIFTGPKKGTLIYMLILKEKRVWYRSEKIQEYKDREKKQGNINKVESISLIVTLYLLILTIVIDVLGVS